MKQILFITASAVLVLGFVGCIFLYIWLWQDLGNPLDVSTSQQWEWMLEGLESKNPKAIFALVNMILMFSALMFLKFFNTQSE
jgi:hypothetical protein